jgi:ZIP family zinc transporter
MEVGLQSSFAIATVLTLIAGLSTVFGGSLVFLLKKITPRMMSFLLSLSAGAMIYIGLIELLPEAIKTNGRLSSLLFFFGGMSLLYFLDKSIPYHCLFDGRCNSKESKRLFKTGSLIAIAIMLHNFPEGIAVFLSSLSSTKFGLLVALITIAHNIPEGIAITAPIYKATNNKNTALKFTLLAGLAEPLGGLFAYLVFSPFMSFSVLTSILAAVAGIMVYISIDELLPECFAQGSVKTSIVGFFVGIVLIGLTLTTV